MDIRRKIALCVAFLGLQTFSACSGCNRSVIGTGMNDDCGGKACASGETCVDGVCTATPGRNDDHPDDDPTRVLCNAKTPSATCKSGYVCQDGVCYGVGAAPASCAAGVNGYCPNADACVSGACTAITAETACTSAKPDGLCPGGQACVGGVCFADDGKLFCSSQRLNGYCPNDATCVEGACQAVTETCSASNQNGTCSAWEACVQGTCVGPIAPDACAQARPNGVCPAQQLCLSGTCVPLSDANACSAAQPQGLCPVGAACENGECVALNPTNACSLEAPTGLCAAGAVCRDGACVPNACQNGGYACPADQVCTMFTCVSMPCDPAHPNGACADSSQACDRGACVAPSCAPTKLDGVCPPQQFCLAGACVPITCSASSPSGTCPGGQRCDAGVCRLTGCADAADPNGFCSPDVCDLSANVCQRPLCGNGIPDGRCPTGFVCTTESGNTSCKIPPCGAGAPGGSCPVGQICATVGGTSQCVTSPCGLAYQFGDCPAGSGRVCCNASRVFNGDPIDTTVSTSDPFYPNVSEQRQCASANYGQCVRKNCGPESAETSTSGLCAAGFSCRSTDGTCQPIVCGVTYPNGPCTGADAGKICVGSPPVCETVCSDADAAHLRGACFGDFVCVTGQCAPACTVAAVMCSATQIICTRDSDCDGISDLAEGAVDAGNDGLLDASSTDTDGDGTPDAFDPDADDDGVLDRVENKLAGTCWRTKDCDGDYISDSVEARVSGANGLDPATVLIDTDNDGAPDMIDTDSDDDGISDRCEARGNCANAARIDFGVNGAPPTLTQLWNSETQTATAPPGTLVDSRPDYRDTDSDGDGISDTIEGRKWPWLPNGTPANNLAFSAPADHDSDGRADYADFDSDNDGVSDNSEDLNGDGVVNCQMSAGNPVENKATDPTCALLRDSPAPYNAPASGNRYYNPLCATSAGAQKCFFAESSRIHTSTSAGTIADGSGGIFLVCSTQNLKPVNVFASQPPDYAFAMEQSFNVQRPLTDATGAAAGMLLNDNVFQGGTTARTRVTGSNAVAGFVLARRPTDSAILASNTEGAPTKWVQKAGAQEAADRALWQAATASTQLNLQSNGFTVILTRSLPSYDQFGNALTRYRIRVKSAIRTSTLRDRLIKAIAGTTQGLPAETLYSNNDAEGGPAATDFLLYTQTLYRFDDADASTNAGNVASRSGRVLLVAALMPYGGGAAKPEDVVRSSTYRPQCTRTTSGFTTQATCEQRDGCAWNGSTCVDRAALCRAQTTNGPCTTGIPATMCDWDALNNLCKEKVEYQIPLFFADNLTNGSAITQYGDLLDHTCETFKQRVSRFDFLWSIDDSGSMGTEIAEVRDSAANFAALIDNSESDYRIASIATDMNLGSWPLNVGNVYPTMPSTAVSSDTRGESFRNGALQRKFSGTSVDTASTAHFTGKIQGLCTAGPATADRSTNACDASLSYFTERLPPDVNGSGSEYVVAMTQLEMYRYGSGVSTCAAVNAQAAGTRKASCDALVECAYNETTQFCLSSLTPCSDVNAAAAGERAAACAAIPTCTYNATAQACYENFCSGVSTAPACDGAETCQTAKNNPSECALLTGCSTATNNDCVNDRCFRVSPGGAQQSDPAACNAKRECRWDTVNSYCNDISGFSCNDFAGTPTVAATCNAASGLGCGFVDILNNTTDDCVSSKCINKDQTTCQATLGCTWRDPSGASNNYCDDSTDFNSSTCDLIAVNTGAGQTACNATAGCVYRDLASNSADDCVSTLCAAQATSNACLHTPGCSWRTAASGGATYCDDTPATIQGEPEPMGCEWSPTYNACVPAMPFMCRGFSSAAACSTAYPGVCSFSGTTCSTAVQYSCRGLNQASCNTRAPTCQWTNNHCERNLLLPFTQCDGNTQATCETRSQGACVWDGTTCQPSIFQSYRNRQDVKHVVVMVSDEEECYTKDANLDGACDNVGSNGGLQEYAQSTQSGYVRAKRTESFRKFLDGRDFTVFAMTGDKADESLPPGGTNGGCNDSGNAAEPNNTAINIAEGTGGAWGSLCPASLAPTIESIVLQVLGSASPYVLSGPGQPVSSTIKVAVETCAVPSEYPTCTNSVFKIVPRSRENGFDYDAATKTILLYGSARPRNNGDIVVSYRYWVDASPEAPVGCPCAQATGPNCNCPIAGEVCAINNADFCAGATQANCAAQSPVLGNCQWVGGSCQHECRTLSNKNTCNQNADCSWNVYNGRCEINYCGEAQTLGACGDIAGCYWNGTLTGGRCVATGFCAIDPTCGDCTTGGVCNPQTGQCTCEAACDGNCATGQVCNASNHSGGLCGTCECPSCPAGGCPQGQSCSAATCGQCVCDTTCSTCTSEGCTSAGCTGTYTCDTNTSSPTCGICLPPSCETQQCPFGQACVGGTCICDKTCGDLNPNDATPACPTGSICDSSATSATCGQCQCDATCGGVGNACSVNTDCGAGLVCDATNHCSCAAGLVCDTNPASPKCGTCRTPVNCSMCPEGQVCDLGVGECVIDPTCGGCGSGFECDPTTGVCVPGQCPPLESATPSSPPPANACTAQNLNCCYGSEGLSPYDGDLDGYLACNSGCGKTIQSCGGDTCDANDNNPRVH